MNNLIALQLYSLRHEFEADPAKTLNAVKALGYDEVELAGTYGWSQEEMKQRLADAGLTAISTHLSLQHFEQDFTEASEYFRALGIRRYGCASIPREWQNTAGYQKVAKILNKAAESAASGEQVFYHNHAFEFDDLGGENGYDILLRETEPELVKFQVDTHWVEHAGRDAADFVARHAARIGTIHAKEMRRADKMDVPAGQGDIDFTAILRLAQSHSWPVIVEYEGSNAPEAVRESAAHLRSLS